MEPARGIFSRTQAIRFKESPMNRLGRGTLRRHVLLVGGPNMKNSNFRVLLFASVCSVALVTSGAPGASTATTITATATPGLAPPPLGGTMSPGPVGGQL